MAESQRQNKAKIALVCALYHEAKPFIKGLNLKKDVSFHPFQLFLSDSFSLIISGTGVVNSASAITYLLALHGPTRPAMVINIGCCATNSINYSTGDIALINAIADECSEKLFYPDMVWQWDHYEASLLTVPKIATHKVKTWCDLIDMEGAGFYQAANKFLSPHQIQLIKVVLDKSWEKEKMADSLADIMEKAAPKIINWLQQVNLALFSSFESELQKNKAELLSLLQKKLKLSLSIYLELKRLVDSVEFTEEISALLKNYAKSNIEHKREGKKLFNELKSELTAIMIQKNNKIPHSYFK